MSDSNQCEFCGAVMADVTRLSDKAERLMCVNERCPGANSLATAREFGVPLLRALGVDPECVTGFTLEVEAGGAITLHLRRSVRSQQAREAINLIRSEGLRVPPAATGG